MVTRRNHGGGCCGAQHLQGFDARHGGGIESENLRQLLRLTSEQPNHLLTEVILSDRQTREQPNLIEKLQLYGFVYTTSWTGNHGTPVHRFERTGRRLALSANNFNWQGMVASDTLQGNLPPLPPAEVEEALRVDAVRRDMRGNEVRIGDTVNIRNTNHTYWNNNVVVIGFSETPAGYSRVDFMVRGNVCHCALSSVVRSQQARQANMQGAAEIPEQLHENAQPAPAQEPQVVHSTYHNNYARTGLGAGFDTLELAQQAGPRCRRRCRRDIYSNGVIETVEL